MTLITTHLLSFVVLFIGSLSTAASVPKNGGGRIVGGTDVTESDWYYKGQSVVSIQQNDHLCTGVIIANRFVLTAASCVVG